MATGLSTVRLPEICQLGATGRFWPELRRSGRSGGNRPAAASRHSRNLPFSLREADSRRRLRNALNAHNCDISHSEGFSSQSLI